MILYQYCINPYNMVSATLHKQDIHVHCSSHHTAHITQLTPHSSHHTAHTTQLTPSVPCFASSIVIRRLLPFIRGGVASLVQGAGFRRAGSWICTPLLACVLSVQVCREMRTFIHTYTHTHTHVYTLTCTHTHTTHVHTRTYSVHY